MKPLLGLHLPSVRGRAWAERGPLLLIVVVVALLTLVASAVPILMPRVGTAAVREAVARAGSRADLVIEAPFEPARATLRGDRVRPGPEAGRSMKKAEVVLGDELLRVTRAPRSVVTTSELTVAGFGPGRVLTLGHLDAPGGGPAVIWTRGQAPKASQPPGFVLPKDQPGRVEAGLSEATARELRVGPGRTIGATDRNNRPVEVRVSGIFRAEDAGDPAWQAAPRLLQPLDSAAGTGPRVELSALLSTESLPDARIALADQDVRRSITFAVDPQQLTWAGTPALAAGVARRKTAPNPIVTGWEANYRFGSGLDRVLKTVHSQGRAAADQARVLLIGLVATAAAILLQTGDLLARRRAGVLAGTRRKGAGMAAIGAELLLESSTVTAVGVALGALAGQKLIGDLSWTWVVPAVAVAVVGPPLLSLREVARSTGTRRSPANRSARLILRRTATLRRITVEAAFVLIAVAAFTALRERGIIAAVPEEDSGSLLPAMAPTLGAVVAALIVVHLMPALLRLALKAAVRTRGSLALLAAARAIATAARPLPLTVVVLVTALLTFSLTLVATTRTGQEEGTLRSVGADARLDLASVPSLQQVSDRIAAKAGVRQAVSAFTADAVKVSTIQTWASLRLVAVDPLAFQKLLATSARPDAPQLSRLKAGAGPLPVLLGNADSRLRSGKALTLSANGVQIPVTDVGTAPATDADGQGFLIVDLAAYTAAMSGRDVEVKPNTVWVNGPRAQQAITEVVGAQGEMTTRAAILRAQRQAPLTVGILDLAHAGAAVLVLLGLLGVALGTASTAPARAQTQARLSTLGLPRAQARRIAFGELLPPVLIGALGGVLAGIILAQASFGGLALRRLTGQAAEPAVVVPWWSLSGVLILVAAVVVTVWRESARRRHLRLGQALRAG